jgi:hypothetical protein|tara:strand:- start:3029 stop:3205 length:177 start_codon:yes stop_codon:yes gene_type:complete
MTYDEIQTALSELSDTLSLLLVCADRIDNREEVMMSLIGDVMLLKAKLPGQDTATNIH